LFGGVNYYLPVMVRFLGIALKRVARPQLAAGLLTILFVVGGYLSLPKIVRPTQAATIPVIRPVQQQVEAISIVAPVDCSRVACIALTFDDGPDPEVTPKVLGVLDRYNAKATFFLIGLHVKGNEAVVRSIHKNGHEIGNHTWSHSNLSELKPAQIEKEVIRAQNIITATGVPAPRLFRPPYGAIDSMVRGHIPLTVVSWSTDPEDWRAETPEDVIDHVLDNARPGAIIDLHDIYPATAEALDPILTKLAQKYQFVTVSELLSLPPGQPGIFYSR
jgi:peptidoglycan/xylan/chitin deacetylase (PgdA/CDA1 family)